MFQKIGIVTVLAAVLASGIAATASASDDVTVLEDAQLVAREVSGSRSWRAQWITANEIRANLYRQDNDPAPVGGGNVVGGDAETSARPSPARRGRRNAPRRFSRRPAARTARARAG